MLKRITIGLFLAAGFCFPSVAQENRTALNAYNNTHIVTNGVGAITASILNSFHSQLITSTANLADTNNFTGSGDVSTLSATSFGNGATSSSTLGARLGQSINVKSDFGATGNAIGFSDGTISASSNAFYSASATFTSADVGKTIIIDYAGASGAPLVTTIAGFTDSHHVTVSASATNPTPNNQFNVLQYSTSQSGAGSYAPGDTFTVSGGAFSTAATGSVATTQVIGATVASAGSGGSVVGYCSVQGTTGTGTKFIASVTLSSGAITAVDGIAFSGKYTANPTTLTNEPVTPVDGCTGLTGAALSVVMGAQQLTMTNAGSYTIFPSSPAATTTSGSGTGLTINTYGTTVTTGTYLYGTDDTAAFNSAIGEENTLYASGKTICMHIPSGTYMINSSINTFAEYVPGCIIGEGMDKTIIAVGPGLSGATFSWSNAWASTIAGFGSGATTNADSGPHIEGLSIAGRPNVSNTQSGIIFYDHADFVLEKDVAVYQMNGYCLATGVIKNDLSSYIRESKFFNFRAWSCGNSTKPAVYLGTYNNGGDADNEIKFYGLDIEGANGRGLVFEGTCTTATERLINIFGLRIESSLGDQLTFGDSTDQCSLSNIKIYGLEENGQQPGTWGINFLAPNGTYIPYQIDIFGMMGSGVSPSWGINVGAGSNIDLSLNYPTGTPLIQVASSTTINGPIVLDVPGGQNGAWTSLVDTTAQQYVYTRALKNSLSGSGYQSSIIGNPHDSTTGGGNPAGVGSVDNQTLRVAPTQVASGVGATISGGEQNTANNNDSTICGGVSNVASGYRATSCGGYGATASGQYSFVGGGISVSLTGDFSGAIGGYSETDRGNTAVVPFAYGNFATAGDAQRADYIFRGTGASTSAIRLTTDGNSAGSNNCLNLPNNSGYSAIVNIMAFDHTTVSKNATWQNWGVLLTRGSSASTTAVVAASTPTPLTNGTLTGDAISVSADTTNGCLKISFTPPTSNTDTWNVVATVRTVEVQ